MQVKKQQLELDAEQQTGFKFGKEYVMAIYCHPAYLTYTQSTSCKMFRLHEAQVGIKILGEISIASDMQMTPRFGRKRRGSKEPLDEGETGK